MKNELEVFFSALMFYTRILCPKWVNHSKANLVNSVRYLPLVGAVVGGVSGAVFVLSLCVFSPIIAAVLSMVAGVLVTGAFHEDGLADVCDGFGGGWTKDKIMLIMKDSRVGAFGAAGMALAFLLKFSALSSLVYIDSGPRLSMEIFIFSVVVAAHVLSRFMVLSTMVTHDYVREENESKAGPAAQGRLKVFSANFLTPLLFSIASLVVFQTWWIGIPVLCMWLVQAGMARFFKKWIGGYTGDCLGAIQQVTEIVFYLGVIAVWKCI